ncbi:MAG: DUF2911 domain-containing protein [Gemmatimonadales bacterium]
MKLLVIVLLAFTACAPTQPEEHYGFLALLGRDTVSIESVSRTGNMVVSDEVDRFPRVRQRHTAITLNDDGSIKRLVMDIHTPSEPENQRDRRVEAVVNGGVVRLSKSDKSAAINKEFPTGNGIAMAHLPQMYSLYDLYFAVALRHAKAANIAVGQPIQMRQFYLDREFDNFPLHHGVVKVMPNGHVEIQHDWLAGTGEATIDSGYRLQKYSGARTTYKVEVTRLAEMPAIYPIGERFATLETSTGGMKQLSVRDTTRAAIGKSTFTVDYARPLARGRALVGGLIPYDQVWRTGANAATQFTTSAPITVGKLSLAAGMYTLWTVPRANGTVELIVNKQTGQWGTEYNSSFDLGRTPLTAETAKTQVDKFVISILPTDARHGNLVMAWGPFSWTVPIVVQ